MPSMGLILLFGGAVGAMLLLYAALSGPATSKARAMPANKEAGFMGMSPCGAGA